MRISGIVLIILAQFDAYSTELAAFTESADKFLNKYVNKGLVDYHAVKKDLTAAGNLYHQIGKLDLSSADASGKKAFYINAYNIVVIYAVAKALPISSPMDVPGFFDGIEHTVAGEILTLNELEHRKLLQPYKDGRIHFVLACAAQSCPPLASFAYTGEDVETKLTERTVLTLNNNEWIKLYPSQKKVEVSKIFQWYEDDFKTSGKSPLAWINQFRKEKIPDSFAVGFYEYDWLLNKSE